MEFNLQSTFLPSDFRIQHLRKCLKRTAAPSVTMKSLDFNSIPANDFSESHYNVKQIVCRLCARAGTESQSKSIHELSSTLVKCLPTIRLNTLDNLPNEVCGDCIKKLVQYSVFIDRVAAVQKDFFGIHADDTDDGRAFNEQCFKESTTKPIIIKQEPVTNIKQEIRMVDDVLPLNATGSGQDYYTDGESDAYCEFCDVYFINNVELKNHIVDFHSDNPSCNPRERANNCEIMEIITLENAAFIDMDENSVEEPIVPPQLMERVLKVEKTTDTEQREVLMQTISIEHNYAGTLDSVSEDSSIVRNLKQEEMNVQVRSFIQTKKVAESIENVTEPMTDDVEATMEPTEIEVTETETEIEHQIESRTSFNDYGQTVHEPKTTKTKICPICTAHCRKIYHYFMHRSKYHNWSKPRRHRRRPKRKLHFKCPDCSKMFLSKFAFDNHNKYSCARLRFKCSICQLEFSSGMSMLIHKRICKVLMAQAETVDKVNRRLKIIRKEFNASLGQDQRSCQPTAIRHTKLLCQKLHRNRLRDETDIKTTIVPESFHLNTPEDSDSLPSKNHGLNKQHICS